MPKISSQKSNHFSIKKERTILKKDRRVNDPIIFCVLILELLRENGPNNLKFSGVVSRERQRIVSPSGIKLVFFQNGFCTIPLKF